MKDFRPSIYGPLATTGLEVRLKRENCRSRVRKNADRPGRGLSPKSNREDALAAWGGPHSWECGYDTRRTAESNQVNDLDVAPMVPEVLGDESAMAMVRLVFATE